MITYGKTQTMPHLDGIITEKNVFTGDPVAWTHIYFFKEKSSKVSQFVDLTQHNILCINKK